MTKAFLAAALAALLALAAAGPASAKTTWLCSPQQAKDPRDYGLATTPVNLAMGNLTTIAYKQIAAYLIRH